MDCQQLSPILSKISPLLEQLNSITLLDKAKELNSINSIAFIGSSAAGKTTIVQAIRALRLKNISIPKRYITRKPRHGDDLNENQHISIEKFQNMLECNLISPHWFRKMENNRIEYYGFERVEKSLFPIYSANNDFVRNSTNQFKDNMLIIGVFAPDHIRARRLLKRSPDLPLPEITYRLKDSSYHIIPYCHLVIENCGSNEVQTLHDCSTLIQEIIQNQESNEKYGGL